MEVRDRSQNCSANMSTNLISEICAQPDQPYLSNYNYFIQVQLFVRKGQFPASQGRMKKETNGQSAEIQLNRPPLHTVSKPGENKYGSARKIL